MLRWAITLDAEEPLIRCSRPLSTASVHKERAEIPLARLHRRDLRFPPSRLSAYSLPARDAPAAAQNWPLITVGSKRQAGVLRSQQQWLGQFVGATAENEPGSRATA